MKSFVIVGWILLAIAAVALLQFFLYASGRGFDGHGGGAAGAVLLLATPIVLAAAAALVWAQRSGSSAKVGMVTLLIGTPFLILALIVGQYLVDEIKFSYYESTIGKFKDPKLTELARTVESRDVAHVKAILEAGGLNLDEREYSKGQTILGLAFESALRKDGDSVGIDIMELLVNAGSKCREDDPEEPLLRALYHAKHGALQLPEILVKGGADPNEKVGKDRTPLILAGDWTVGIVRWLIAHGVDAKSARYTSQFRPGWNALMGAVGDLNWPLAEFYLDQGLDPKFLANDGRTLEDIVKGRRTEENQSSEMQSFFARLDR